MKKTDKLILWLSIVTSVLAWSPAFSQNVEKIKNDTAKNIATNLDWIELAHDTIIKMNVEDILKIYGNEKWLELIREHMLIEINKLRKEMNNYPPLKLNNILNISSKKYSEYMSKNNHFSHTDKEWLRSSDRIKNEWGNFEIVWENLARWQESIEKVLDHRLNYSASHRKNLLFNLYTDLGVWYYNWYWVLNFWKK